MDCLALLKISARLIDLHDSLRAPGNSPVYSQENRPGLKDGRYIDLAEAVLDLLREHAHRSGNAFVGFETLCTEVRLSRPSADPDDLRYVLNVLSRSTELWTIVRGDDVPQLVSDKATELVEKAYYADDYRLAPTGRVAIAVAGNIQKFAYTEGDVLKLLRAIQAGDFSNVPIFCASILDTIRYESVDLRQAIEKGFVDQQSIVYKEQLPRYRQVIKHSAELLRQADAELKSLRKLERDELDQTLPIDIFVLEQHLLSVYQALEAFGREISELTSLAAQRRVSVVEAPDFIEAALRLVKSPASTSQLKYFFRQFGPLSFAGKYPSPMDAAGKVRILPTKAIHAVQFDTDGAAAITNDVRLVFLEAHRAEIVTRLKQGPLSLSEATSKGWCYVEGQPAWEELLGIFVAPWFLSTNASIEVRVPKELDRLSHPDVGTYAMADLELILLNQEAN
ncbi:hypothetical protein [Permianibacter aggregans]|uniref:Uncharacterized protein n=1 Tax=Permianibacter aggregans TaxID=1510150 RepID=A0A4R6UKC5_9GAMM|nr:hypothetical protein [Permianibacter aggregans]QGX40168.1 hypothetical protein E2H98_10995 [Permianibacter aggregans]TDQ47418.1 hypothetical protein EV696_11010 [Permianibacter aggregans]